MGSKINSGAVFTTCLAITILATVGEPHYQALGFLLWPGALIALLIFLILHLKYFDHPTVVTCMNVVFNAFILWGIFQAARAVYRRFGKSHRYSRT
jgi:uncharacterized membrane protein YjgN (DUF898 family)